MLTAVLAAKPWMRRRSRPQGRGVVTQRFEGGAWSDVHPSTPGLAIAEAHAWLALLHMLSHAPKAGMDPTSVARSVQAASKELHTTAVEALPALEWIARAAEEARGMQHIHLGPASDGSAATPGPLLLDLLPPWRQPMMRSTHWAALVAASTSGSSVFADTPAATERAREEASAAAALWDDTLSFAGDGDDLPGRGHTSGEQMTPPELVRVHVMPLIDGGSNKTSSGGWHFDLVPDGRIAGEPVTVSLPAAEQEKATTSVPVVRGLRWPLRLPAQLRRLVPNAVLRCETLKVASGAAIQQLVAQLALPGGGEASRARQELQRGSEQTGKASEIDPETVNAWQQAPPVVWVTLGTLAGDGCVLQLRCARVAAPTDVGLDAQGQHLLYRPAGGALTVRVGR